MDHFRNTEYEKKKFSVGMSGDKAYENNYNKIFRKSLKERIKIKIELWICKLFLGG